MKTIRILTVAVLLVGSALLLSIPARADGAKKPSIVLVHGARRKPRLPAPLPRTEGRAGRDGGGEVGSDGRARASAKAPRPCARKR